MSNYVHIHEEVEIEFVCDKCGKPQKPDKEKSTENWTVYKNGEKCKCGGEYKMDIN